MTAAPFTYCAPRTVEDAVRELARPGAVALAGGQSLVRALTQRVVRPEVVVDINGVEGLDRVDVAGDRVVVGALVRMRAVERDPVVAEALPVLVDAVRMVGHPQVRTRATIGGSLCQADPSAELPVVAVALGARLVLRSLAADGEVRTRVVAAAEFFSAPGTTRAPGELLTAVEFPRPDRAAVAEFSVRTNDLPLAVVCAAVTGDVVRAAAGGIADRPVITQLDGGGLGVDHAPPAGPHATPEYRLALVRTLLAQVEERLR
ncbi:FAD binding domain-containing protein [Actinokineospora sp. NPDC004072]